MTADLVRSALQAVLDADGDGWVVGPHVTAMGIERVLADGTVESYAWYLCPTEQAEWVTSGLLASVLELRATAEASD